MCAFVSLPCMLDGSLHLVLDSVTLFDEEYKLHSFWLCNLNPILLLHLSLVQMKVSEKEVLDSTLTVEKQKVF